MTMLVDENAALRLNTFEFRHSTSSSESQLRFVFAINLEFKLNFKFITNANLY